LVVKLRDSRGRRSQARSHRAIVRGSSPVPPQERNECVIALGDTTRISRTAKGKGSCFPLMDCLCRECLGDGAGKRVVSQPTLNYYGKEPLISRNEVFDFMV